MAKTRLQGKAGVTYNAGQGLVSAKIDSTKVVTVGDARTTQDSSTILAQFPELREIGRVGLTDDTCAGNSTELWTVPAGKYWRLLSMVHVLVTDANVANRAVVVTTRTVADATIEALTHANVAADNAGAQRTTLFGTAPFSVGSRGVAATGTITIGEPVTDGDSFTIGTKTYTFKTADVGATGTTILIGANEAATKVNIAAAINTTGDPLVTGPATWTSGDTYLCTAREKGLAGTDIVFVEVVLTHASNVLDGTGTLGAGTEGVDFGDKVSALDYPTAGVLLGPGEDVIVSVTNGVAGDTLTTFLSYIEFDNNPV